MAHNNGMNAYNFNKKIERLEKEIDKLKHQLNDKDNQIKFRERKFDELKETTNNLFDEKQKLIEENERLRQQTCQETEKEYIVCVSWDGDFNGELIDTIFEGMCLKKTFTEESTYGYTQAYKYYGTPSARKILTRCLTSICNLNYPEANIHVYAKEMQTIHTS